MDKSQVGVHVTHCCVHHGCKYGDDDCPVYLGDERQEFPCEECSYVDRTDMRPLFDVSPLVDLARAEKVAYVRGATHAILMCMVVVAVLGILGGR